MAVARRGEAELFATLFRGTPDPFGAEDHKVGLENLAQQGPLNSILLEWVSMARPTVAMAQCEPRYCFPDFYKVCVSLVGFS